MLALLGLASRTGGGSLIVPLRAKGACRHEGVRSRLNGQPAPNRLDLHRQQYHQSQFWNDCRVVPSRRPGRRQTFRQERRRLLTDASSATTILFRAFRMEGIC